MSLPIRRVPLALLLAGLAAVGTGVAGMAGASAGTEPGSGLGPVDVTATAAGVRMPLYSSGGEDVENQAPWATVTMSSGLQTHALTTVFWPGDTGGHGGDTLALLSVPCILENPQGLLPVDPPCVVQPSPPPASVVEPLNDPYKAEVQSGSGPSTATNAQGPATLTATAKAGQSIASTTIDGSKIQGLGDQFGRTTTTTSTKAVGAATVVTDATSVMHDISLGGGAIHIQSLTSVAHAVSDTVNATGSASTVVHGMTIGGVPVTVDEKGIHVGPQSDPLPATSQINQALAQSGFKIFVAAPSKTVKGASIILDSGSLVLMQNQPGYTGNANDTGKLLILGGTSIQASTGKGFDFGGFSVPPPSVTPAVPPAATGSGASGVVPASGGSAPVTAGAATAPVVAGGQPLLAAQGLQLPGGIGVGWVVLTLLGAGLCAGALKRLPDRVLSTDGPGCSLGQEAT